MNEQTPNILVAVPYYGSLSLPPLGLSRVFFVAAVDAETGRVGGIELQVWDPKKEPNLSVWMRQQGYSGVICSDSGSHYQVALNAEGIWLIGGEEGEAEELVERWAAGALRQGGSWSLRRQFGSWCGGDPEGAMAV